MSNELLFVHQEAAENSGDDFDAKDDDAEDFSNINEAVTDDATRYRSIVAPL